VLGAEWTLKASRLTSPNPSEVESFEANGEERNDKDGDGAPAGTMAVFIGSADTNFRRIGSVQGKMRESGRAMCSAIQRSCWM